MLSHLVLFTLLGSAPVYITKVLSTVGNDEVAVQIEGDSGLDADAVRSRLSDGHLVLNVTGTRVHSDARAWGQGERTIRAHRHSSHTELDVPLPSSQCEGPARISRTAEGAIKVLLACPGARAGATRPVPHAVKVPAAERLVAVPPAAVASAASAHVVVVPAVVAPNPSTGTLPAPPAGPPVAGIAGADAARLKAALALDVSAPLSVAVASPTVASAPVAASAVPSPSLTSAPAAPSSWRVVVVPVLALLLLGAVSVFLGRRRKATTKLVTILETASLGPKRSLVVARVGGETLVLGSSEAGITLLRSQSLHPDAAKASGHDDIQIDEADDDDDVAGAAHVAPRKDLGDRQAPGQVRFLARLFGDKAHAEPGVEPWNFEGLLEDSLEDQDLRRKLAAGFGARIP